MQPSLFQVLESVLTSVSHDPLLGFDFHDAKTLRLCDQVDASGFRSSGRLDVTRPVLLFNLPVGTRNKLSITLMRDYPAEMVFTLISDAGMATQHSVSKMLHELSEIELLRNSFLYIPALPPALRKPDITTLAGIMAKLRSPEGCPWDREQTRQTLRKYFIEETYEVIEAIDQNDMPLLCEELGDALLQVVFHAQLTYEDGRFSLDDVIAGIVNKLVRRHPHVFADTEVADSDEVLVNWEKIKRGEKPESGNKSIIDGVPAALPSLMRAMEISKKAAKIGFEWGSISEVVEKLEEEVEELKEAIRSDSNLDISSELGDLLFCAVQIARWTKLDAEECLREMLSRFRFRFQWMERLAAEQGTGLIEMNIAEMEVLWQNAKNLERMGDNNG